ncbi:aldo/keto reductase [Streptomyces violaceorubidus]
MARGVGLLAAMPLGNGYLTGTPTRPGRGSNRRTNEPGVRGSHAEMMAANQPIVAGLRRIAARHGEGVTTAQVALAWVPAQGPHVVPVPGTKQERWATENAGAARGGAERTGSGGAGDALPPAHESWE